ncbi:hypothetical protein CTI12_AA540270 [Artemisia annua]|uniref:RNA-directed DNA polymerase, eukaryota, Reverse transcriptase zinc-binding domain protein n=1 Tax=Artemisia annua TaxID=35608 RepID=A0A2U1L1R9_ARTAN|nr:hypothetical protein CTI12_AA540270 [Artemisia annua]
MKLMLVYRHVLGKNRPSHMSQLVCLEGSTFTEANRKAPSVGCGVLPLFFGKTLTRLVSKVTLALCCNKAAVAETTPFKLIRAPSTEQEQAEHIIHVTFTVIWRIDELAAINQPPQMPSPLPRTSHTHTYNHRDMELVEKIDRWRDQRQINDGLWIIDSLRDRLSSWKARSLSVVGRLTLIKFENDRGINWVKWFFILLDSKFGGLEVGSLRAKNLSILGKRKWRFFTEDHVLWRTIIKELYVDDGSFDLNNNLQGNCGVWSDIIKAIKQFEVVDLNFKKSFIRKVDDGANTSFWHDMWCSNG